MSGDRVVRFPCGHVFHTTCVARWFAEVDMTLSRCPNCRHPVFDDSDNLLFGSRDFDVALPGRPATAEASVAPPQLLSSMPEFAPDRTGESDHTATIGESHDRHSVDPGLDT